MKRIVVTIFLITLLLISLSASAQFSPRFSTGVSILPGYGVGITGVWNIQMKTGIYVTYGHSTDCSADRFKSAQKVSTGLQIIDKVNKLPFFWNVGTSYNWYENINPLYASKEATQPIDFQVGAGVYAWKVCIGFRYDVLKNDASIDLMLNFGKQHIKR